MISTSGISLQITAEEIALLKDGLEQPPNHPAHDLAVRILDKLENRALGNLPPEQAQVLLQTVCAPMALRAARHTIADLRAQLEQRKDRCACGAPR